MDSALLNDFGLLALRVSLAYVYLHGAWMIAGTSERRRLTAERSMVLLERTQAAGNLGLGRLLGRAATLFMLAGGVGLLAGLATRQAALLLIVFTIPGIVVHLRELARSVELVDAVAAHSGGEPAAELAKLRWSAYSGHRSSANKNCALIGAAVFLVLSADPDGRFSCAALLGL